MRLVFEIIIFPGFLFTAFAGMLASWVDRKVTARIQWRQGPPLLQPLYDFVKLTGKEIIVPEGSIRSLFLVSPVIGLAAVTVVSLLIWRSFLTPTEGFLGDSIVAIYLLTLPALSLIMGAFASRNPFASVGAGREMKLMLSYELPFLLALFVPIIKSGYQLNLGYIYLDQVAHGSHLFSLSGFLGLLVAVICMQAKLGLVPFDMAEAEGELMGGTLIEYAGIELGFFKLTKWMMLFVVPLFIQLMFLSGTRVIGRPLFGGIIAYLSLLFLIILIRNTNPRIRIDQALRFFWGPVTVTALAAVICALIGI
jgi:NADH-quinone oxidoreductase subunit H